MPGRSADDVEEILRKRILSGDYPRHSKLPTQEQLADELDASEGNVQRAIQGLRRDGLVSAQRGKGTIVTNTPRITYDLRDRYTPAKRTGERGAFAAELARQGIQLDSETTVNRVPAPDEVADLLDIEHGALVLERGRKMFDISGGKPGTLLQVAPSFIPGDIAFGTQLENTVQPDGGMLTTMEQIGHDEVDGYNILTPSRPPSSEEAVLFGINRDQPLFEMYHVGLNANGRPVEVSWHRGPAHLFRFIFPVNMK